MTLAEDMGYTTADGRKIGGVVMEMKNITLRFGGVVAIKDISFDIREGEIRAIIGPNGAGKSSMLNVISGFYVPQDGEVLFHGKKRPQMKPFEVAQQGIARTFQNIALFEGMSVLDNVMTGRLTHMNSSIWSQALWKGKAEREEVENREICERIIDFLEIQSIRKTPVARLPYGLKKRVALSSAKQAVLSRRSGLDQSNARFNQAKTRLARAELANKDALRHLNDTVMRAEFAGVLSGVSLVQGGLISANERVGQLIDPSALEVAFRVSTQQYARLLNEDGTLVAAPADVSLDAIGGSVTSKAVLSRDSGSVANGQTGRVLFAKLDNAIGLKPGDFVSVKVEEPSLRFVVELPATALNAQSEVLAVGEGDRIETINVTLMRRQGNNVLVRSRDLPGRDIVTQQTPLLGKGIKVKVLREGGSMEPEAPKMVKLTKEKQEELIKRVEGNQWIPAKPKERLLKQLRSGEIKAETLKRLESRGGG